MAAPSNNNIPAPQCQLRGVLFVRRARQGAARFRPILCGLAFILVGATLLGVLVYFTGCTSTVKVDPAKSEATRTVDGGSTTLTVDVWPKGKGPTQ